MTGAGPADPGAAPRPPDRPARYIHGTAPEEQRRLTVLNRLLNETSLRELDLRGGERILDVGCGLAQLTRAAARAAGRPALGVERSPEQIAEARRQARAEGEEEWVELREGDAFSLPLRAGEWGAFDVVHARFLLEHVPDPLRAVGEMLKAARPGGRIVLEDDDHDVLRLWPEPEGFAGLWRAYVRAYERDGNDPYVGRRLVSLLHEAGARPRRNRWIFFGACAGSPELPALVENLAGLLAGAREAILAAGELGADAFARGVAELRAWGGRSDAAFWFARCWAEGTRPE